MKIFNVLSLFIVFILFASNVFASSFSGDGKHILREGDVVIASNGWKFEVTGIFSSYTGSRINYLLYDAEGNFVEEGSFLGVDG